MAEPNFLQVHDNVLQALTLPRLLDTLQKPRYTALPRHSLRSLLHSLPGRWILQLCVFRQHLPM